MKEYTVDILSINHVTHDVVRIQVNKPDGYKFKSGQATEVSIKGKEKQFGKGPFTFTSLNEDPYLEFTIKIYEEHDSLTKEIEKLNSGDSLVIRDPWGTISYKGSGVFIAGGAGVTPFISIFRMLHKKGNIKGNNLIFSNKTTKDIILKDEFEKMLGPDFINVITNEKTDKYYNRRLDINLIKELVSNFNQQFYICGPDQFVKDIKDHLEKLGASTESVVLEE
jgi:ferredoxin-NADP reductase